MEKAPDEFAPNYLLHRLNRIRRIPHADTHPFQTVSAEKFAPPQLPNQIIDDVDGNSEFRVAPSLQTSLHWGTAVRAAPLVPKNFGTVMDKSNRAVSSRKTSDLVLQQAVERPASRVSSLYATLPAVAAMNSQEILGRIADKNSQASTITKMASASAREKVTATKVLDNSRHQLDLHSKVDAAAQQPQVVDDFSVNGVMAAWVSHRKAFDNGSMSWDLQMSLYSQELVEDFTTDNFKQKRTGAVADLRARAVQRKVKGISTSSRAVMSDEEQMALKEQVETMKRNKKLMDLRLGRVIEEVADQPDPTAAPAVAPGRTGTKTNAELEFEAVQTRAIQAAREKKREVTLASSSRLRALGHVHEENIESEMSVAQNELRLEAFRSYKLNIPSRDSYCEQIQEALKKTFYFAAGTTQEQHFVLFALQNCGVQEPYILDIVGCSLSERAGSSLGMMMGTPMNQLTALHARDFMVPLSSWRFMCDGLRLSRTLSVFDISFARGAPQSSEGMELFSSAMKKNVSLIELIAHGLPLGVSNHATSLGEAIGTHVRLRKVDFSDCSISDYSMNALCDALGKNSMQLQEIRLSGNNFSAVSVTLLLRAICTATSVVHTLVCNRINLDSLYEYPMSLLSEIRAARQMRNLQMDDCGLGCSGGLVLLSMLMQLPCVRTLSFQRNNIDDSSGSRSLFWLKPLSSALALERLSLSHNRLHDEAVLFMIKVIKSGNAKLAQVVETVNDNDAVSVQWGQGAPMLHSVDLIGNPIRFEVAHLLQKYLSKKHEDFIKERGQLRMLDLKRVSSTIYGATSNIAKRVLARAEKFFSRVMHQAQATLSLKLNDELQCLFLIRRYPNDIELSLLYWGSLLVNPNLSSFFPELIDAAVAARYEDFGRDYRKERMKRVLELKQIHDETREQQKQTRSNILEVDPDAILPELSDSPFWDSSGDDELERIQQLKSKASASFQEQAAMLESQAKFEAERLSRQMFTVSGFIEFLELMVKTRLEKKERRKKARLAFKEKEKQHKLEDVRFRVEARLHRRQGRRLIGTPIIPDDKKVIRDDKDSSEPAEADQHVSESQEKPIYPQHIHGGSLAADKLIRSKMVPGDSIGQILALIEKCTPQFHQDLIDGESSDVTPTDIKNAALKKYGAIILERVTDELKGRFVLPGHVQQLVQKLQRSPFFGIVVPVCVTLQSKAVTKETYENDVIPFLNKLQRNDFALFMKRVREMRAQQAATVEQVRQRLQGQKILLVHYCRERNINENAYVSQREIFDILLSAKVNANEAKSVISTLDPLVYRIRNVNRC